MIYLHYIGILLGVWLTLGFLTATRLMLFECKRYEESLRRFKELKQTQEDYNENVLELMSNKKIVFAMLFLMGGVSFWIDFKTTFLKK